MGDPQTLWSWTLHTLCFLPVPANFWTLLMYGPSFGGSWALMAMWMWTMFANPQMEVNLAPQVSPPTLPAPLQIVIYVCSFGGPPYTTSCRACKWNASDVQATYRAARLK